MNNKNIRYDAKYWYFLLLVLFLGSATIYTANGLESVGLQRGEGESILQNLIGKLIMFVFATFLMLKKKVQITKCYSNLLFILLIIWAGLQYIKFRTFSPYTIMRLMNIYFAFSIIELYGFRSAKYYEDVVYKLSFIGLILWVAYLLAPNLITEILELSPIKGDGLEQYTIFIWGNMELSDAAIVPRNCGFAWEPGRYGCIVAIAIFFNLMINGFKLKNKRLVVLTLSLLSSLSTTAYACLALLTLFYLYNTKIKYFFFMLPLVIAGFAYMFSLDFMGEKIKSLWITQDNLRNDLMSMMDYYGSIDQVFVPQRFYGLYLEALNIIHEPIIGNATAPMEYLHSLFGVNMSLSNGCLRIFANMGIVFGFLYYLYLYRGSKWLRNVFHYKGNLLFIILFVFINISYSFIFEPLYLAYVLIPYYRKRDYEKLVSC